MTTRFNPFCFRAGHTVPNPGLRKDREGSIPTLGAKFLKNTAGFSWLSVPDIRQVAEGR